MAWRGRLLRVGMYLEVKNPESRSFEFPNRAALEARVAAMRRSWDPITRFVANGELQIYEAPLMSGTVLVSREATT